MNKAYKIKLYPNKKQAEQIDKTIGCSRFIFNQMLNERINVYTELKEDKEKLYAYKYKTEKEYKQEFEFLKEASSRALQQSRNDLDTAFKNFFKGKGKFGFPKFKSKKTCKLSYREPQVVNQIRIEGNKIKLLKLEWIKFKGLSKEFKGIIKFVTITKQRNGEYFASVLVERNSIIKQRKENNNVGIDLGLKEFIVCSNGESIKGIKEELLSIEKKIKNQHRHLSRKIEQNKKRSIKDTKRQNKCRIKLVNLYKFKTNFLNHFQWHLVNKLCNENKIISLENLNVRGMLKNRKLSHAIHLINWTSFVTKLEQKAKEYGTQVIKIDRFFPSSKLCSCCGQIKKDLTLSDRDYKCDCGLEIDRDFNASINILKAGLSTLSLEYSDYKRGEKIRPLNYNSKGIFSEALKESNSFL